MYSSCELYSSKASEMVDMDMVVGGGWSGPEEGPHSDAGAQAGIRLMAEDTSGFFRLTPVRMVRVDGITLMIIPVICGNVEKK